MIKKEILEAIYLKARKKGTTLDQCYANNPTLAKEIENGCRLHSKPKLKSYYNQVFKEGAWAGHVFNLLCDNYTTYEDYRTGKEEAERFELLGEDDFYNEGIRTQLLTLSDFDGYVNDYLCYVMNKQEIIEFMKDKDHARWQLEIGAPKALVYSEKYLDDDETYYITPSALVDSDLDGEICLLFE